MMRFARCTINLYMALEPVRFLYCPTMCRRRRCCSHVVRVSLS